MNRERFRAVWAGLLGLGIGSTALGATPAQIQTAIDNGVTWLVSQQQANGSWQGHVGFSSLALSVLGHHALDLNTTPLAAGYVYQSQYEAGISNLMAQAFHDTANERIWFGAATLASAQNYFSGPAIMAIALSATPDRVVNQPGIPVHGLTYREVVQRIVNTVAHVQLSAGNAIGAWDYTPSRTAGDLSISGWVTLGLGYARDRFEIELPTVMMDRISASIDIMQQSANPASENFGGGGYRSTYNPAYSYWVNTHKTGHLLYMMYLVGDEADTVRVLRAIDYLVRHWSSPTVGTVGTHGWRGNPPTLLPSYIGTVTIMKGLVEFEIEEIGDAIDWFDDVTNVIVANQRPNGSWISGYPGGEFYAVASTAFALLTLLRATPLATVDAAFENISYTTADYLVTSGMAGTGYYIVVPRDATAPTEEQIRNGANYAHVTVAASGSGAVEEDVEALFSLAGLTAGTAYDLYFVVQAPDNSYGLVVKSPFNTLAYTVPTVSETHEPESVTANSAASGGVVSQSGGLPVTQRGVVWSTLPGPTLENHVDGGFTIDGDGLGAFNSLLTGLNPDTVYYVRAYAVNDVGAGYAPGVIIATPERAIPLLGQTTFQYGWYARVSEYQLRCRFVFDEPLQPENGPLQMRRLWLDTPDDNTYTVYHYTNQTAFGSNVLFHLVSLSGYGEDIPSDGEYTLHLEFADESVTQTVFRFFIPGTTNPLPTPTQFPVITSPIQGSDHTGTVNFAWSPVTDTNVTFVNLVSAGQTWTLPPETSAYGPVELPFGDRSFEVWFMHGYDGLFTDEGIPYQIGKGNSRVHTFQMINDTEFTLNYSAGIGGVLVGDPMQIVPFGGDGNTVEAQPQLEAVFGGWTDGLGGNPRTDQYVTNDITAMAWFTSPAGVPLDWYDGHGISPGPGETWADVDQNDEDEDGVSNADEYFADTDPNEPGDSFRIDAINTIPEVTVEFISSTNRLYQLHSTYDIESGIWYTIPGEEPRPGVGGPDVLHDHYAPTYPHYYRIEATTP